MGRSKSFLVLTFRALAFLAILSPGSAHPQSPAAVPQSPSAQTGSVTGFVYYGETRLPARFAEINIVPIPSEADAAPATNPPNPGAAPQQQGPHVLSVSGRSGMDGSFRLDGVPEGDYVVAAVKPGYIVSGAAAAMDFTLTEDQLKSLIASLPQVRVSAGGAANVNLTLHRGAVITGRVQFADGSPVIGAMVGCDLFDSVQRFENLMRPENRGRVASPRQQALQLLSAFQGMSQRAFTTDDEGRYRIFGLLPGKYILNTGMALEHSSQRVVMSDGSNPHAGGREPIYPEAIAVYAPATFRRKDAKIFEVHGDEQITAADLTIDPKGLHILLGKVLTADNRHAPMTMIRVKEEGAKEIPRLVESEEDGTFQINYLPPGSYTLQINSFDGPDPANSVPPKIYKTVELTAVIVDHDVLLDDVLVVPLKPGERIPDPLF